VGVNLSELDKLARRQHGIVTRNQTGVSSSSWHRSLRSGRLIQIHPGVARLVGTSSTPEQRIIAGVLAAGPNAVASHRSAAHLHGIPSVGPPPVDVIVRPNIDRPTQAGQAPKVAPLDDVIVHRPRDITRLKPARRDGIACTNILRTLVDLGAVAPDAVHGAVGHALTNDLASLDALETTLTAHARPGRAGIRALRSAIDDWALDAKPADSVLEPAFHRLVGRYGLPAVEFHPQIGGREVDFRIIGTPIIIECDGWRFHGRLRPQFERDKVNDGDYTSRGWVILRFTYRRITSRPWEVANVIRRTVDRWVGLPIPGAA